MAVERINLSKMSGPPPLFFLKAETTTELQTMSWCHLPASQAAQCPCGLRDWWRCHCIPLTLIMHIRQADAGLQLCWTHSPILFQYPMQYVTVHKVGFFFSQGFCMVMREVIFYRQYSDLKKVISCHSSVGRKPDDVGILCLVGSLHTAVRHG